MSGETIVSVFAERARTHGDRPALKNVVDPDARPGWHDLTWSQWHVLSRGLACWLVANGKLQRGDRVAIFAGNSNWWPIADLGVLMAGGVTVGIYPTSSGEQLLHMLRDSGAVMAIADAGDRYAMLTDAARAAPALRRHFDVWGMHEAIGVGCMWMRTWPEKTAAHLPAVAPADLACLIYTSGSTGEPKGARILHRTVVASARSIRDTLGLSDGDSTLSFLPYSHAGERIFGLYTRILTGMRVAHVHDGERIWEIAREQRPTLFGGLPRWYEKIHDALLLEAGRLQGDDRERWQRAMEVGRRRAWLRRRGEQPAPVLEDEWGGIGRPCRELVARFVGDNVRLATSGGAKLPAHVADDLDAAGLTVLGAYGQTEHLCAAFHRPDRYDTDTVGFPMPGTEVKLDDDGELLVRRSDLTFDGYHCRDEETRAAFTADGEWLRTGDLAWIEPDGRIRITGRKKELIALSNGKKVAPLPIEAALAAEPWIASAMLYGEGERFITALVIPRRAVVESWLAERGVDEPFERAVQRDEVRAEVGRAIERVNTRFSRPEQVRRWVILEHELSAERGELTPTMKIRRKVVTERYRDRLQPLYQT